MTEKIISQTVKTFVDPVLERIEVLEITRLDDQIIHQFNSFVNLKEHAVREALIKLGWTPPKQ